MTDMDRKAEFDAFKQLNLSLIASAYGYEIVRKKSTRHSVLMASGSDKIVINQKGGRYVYFSVHDPLSAGTVIDFAQRVIEPGCSLGRVRQLLRPYLGAGYLTELENKQRDRFQRVVSESEQDLAGVAARCQRFAPISVPLPYLCQTRGIPFELLQSDRLRGRVRHCPRRGSVVFPHWDTPAALREAAQPVCGYEIKGRGVNLFSKGGKKGLWMTGAKPGDHTLAVAESGLDALSYLAVRGEEGTIACSISGQLSASQPDLIQSVLSGLKEGTCVVAAFDNDRGGDTLTERLADIVRRVDRADLKLVDDRPGRRGADWNQEAVQLATKFTRSCGAGPTPGR